MVYEKWNEKWTFWNDRTPEKRDIVNLPHDAMLTERRLKNIKNGAATGFFPGGKYHYVKKLYGRSEYEGQCVMLEFEGVYMKSSVYLNGQKVGGRIYGYSTFFVDLTDKLLIGQENEIEVIADNTQTPNSRWYSGSGIYRDVYLLIGGKKHLVQNGTKLITTSVREGKHCEATVSAAVAVGVWGKDVSGSDRNLLLNNSIKVRFYQDGVLKAESAAVPCMPDQQEKAKDGWGEFGEAKGAAVVRCDITIEDAKLWSEESPNLYDVEIVLLEREKEIDMYKLRTGLRLLTWNADRGMCVNGKAVKLRGGCVHHDHGPLGAVSIYKAELRRAKILKEIGFNAVRYSHNPAGKAFLDACDEAGLYVMVEAFDQWKGKQSDYDYGMYFEKEWEKDLTAMIEMAVNHPCVVMYSYGNEISDVGTAEGPIISKMLNEHCHALDASRPTTNAVNPVVAAMGSVSKSKTTPEDVVNPYEETAGSQAAGSLLANMIVTVAPFMSKVMGRPKKQEKLMKSCYEQMDVVGYNYSDQCYAPHHEWAPERVMVGSETYPPELARNWAYIKKVSHVIGDFMWTAWDYLGEAGIGVPIYGTKRGGFNRPYPCVSAGCGAVDMTGKVETPGRYAGIIWEQYRKPYIAVRPVNHSGEKYFFGMWRGTDATNSWSWDGMEGKKAQIEVYSIGSCVELFQDGKSLGTKSLEYSRAYYETVYQPGELKAVSYDEKGKRLGEASLVSAKGAEELRITPEEQEIRADGEDLLYGAVEVTDSSGIVKYLSDRRVTITVEGAGSLVAVGSGNPYTEDSFLGNSYETYGGRMIFIVKSNGQAGEITVTAKGEGFSEKSCKVVAR